MPETAVLIVEDEPDIAELIRFHVEREGHRARVVHSGKLALSAVASDPPSLLVLDLMLPDVDGLEVCRRLRWDERTRALPILIVSAKGEEADVVAGLELGADDYVTKPFSPKVLVARIRNLLRRRERTDEADESRRRIELGDGALVIDVDQHRVFTDGEPADLTRTEFDILRYLASRPDFVRTRDQITAAVHGERAVLTSRTIDVHMTALRRKLGRHADLIETVRGVGYRLTRTTPDPGDRA